MRPFKTYEYKSYFLDKKKDKNYVVNKILKDCSYEDLIYYYNQTPSFFKGIFKHALSYLKRERYQEVYGYGLYSPKDEISYLGWLAFVIPLFKNELNNYVKLRMRFEDCYLIGDYDSCYDILRKCNLEISYSYWSASNEIRLSELENGVKSRVEKYNAIVENASPAMEVMCSVAQELSFNNKSCEAIADERFKDIQEHYKEWEIRFLKTHCFPFKYEPLGEWMSFDMNSSLIDLYAFFVLNLHKYIERYRDNKLVNEYICIICDSINDPFLHKYASLVKIKSIIPNKERFHLLLNMEVCHAELEMNSVVKRIKENPSDVDFIFSFLQYLVRSKLEYKALQQANCLIEIFSSLLFGYLEDPSREVNTHEIKSICYTNPTLIAFRQIYEITSYLTNDRVDNRYKYIWHYSFDYNIYDSHFYLDEEERNDYLRIVGADFISRNDKLLNFPTLFPSIVSDSIDIIENNISTGLIPKYRESLYLSYLVNRYFLDRKYREAVIIYVNNSILKNYIKIDLCQEVKNIRLSRQEDIDIGSPLDLSIFYFITKHWANKVSPSVTRFLADQNVDLPSDLPYSDDPKMIFFLEKVVSRDIIGICPNNLEDDDQVIEERLKICRKLKKICDKQAYSDEIAALVKEQGINNFLKVVDSSKINVDEFNLKKNELSYSELIFLLYRSTDKDEMTLASAKDLIIDGHDDEQPNLERRTISSRFQLFRKFYLSIRDQFLLNDHAGLDYYLSSRVRHGTIVNQLRHHFQELRLTTLKNEYDNYDVNTYWADEVLKLVGENWVKCTEAFMLFTENIDKCIFQLKDQFIQVKTENHKSELVHACFDYSEGRLNQKIVELYKQPDMDYHSYVDAVFNDLWEHTETCFEEVQKSINGTERILKDELNKLNINVKSVVNPKNPNLSRFTDSVTRCHQQIKQDIDAVKGWFQHLPSSEYDFTMQQLLDASIEGINKINDSNLNVIQDINCEAKLSGAFLTIFYDLFHNLLNNVLEYAKVKMIPPSCKVSINNVRGFLNIVIENQIFDEDKDEAQEHIDNYHKKKNHSDPLLSTRTEGLSGMAKNDCIIYYQMKSDGNLFNPHIEDNRYIVEIKIALTKISAR